MPGIVPDPPSARCASPSAQVPALGAVKGAGMTIVARSEPTGAGEMTVPVRRRTGSVDLAELADDQALTSTDEGRELVEWLSAHAVDAGEWSAFVGTVPAGQLGTLARTARECAQAWVEFAEALERRPTTR